MDSKGQAAKGKEVVKVAVTVGNVAKADAEAALAAFELEQHAESVAVPEDSSDDELGASTEAGGALALAAPAAAARGLEAACPGAGRSPGDLEASRCRALLSSFLRERARDGAADRAKAILRAAARAGMPVPGAGAVRVHSAEVEDVIGEFERQAAVGDAPHWQ